MSVLVHGDQCSGWYELVSSPESKKYHFFDDPRSDQQNDAICGVSTSSDLSPVDSSFVNQRSKYCARCMSHFSDVPTYKKKL